MSLIAKIQNLFKRQNKLPEDSMDMSAVGMQADPFATGAMQSVMAESMLAPDDRELNVESNRLSSGVVQDNLDIYEEVMEGLRAKYNFVLHAE